MAVLPELAQGVLHYNGFTFPPAISLKVSAVPVRDSTGRYTSYTLHTVQVETIVFPGCDEGMAATGLVQTPIFPSALTSTDGNVVAATGLEQLRAKLTEQGKSLWLSGKGYGDLNVPEGSGHDVMFGPKPRVLQWEPIAGTCSARIVWAVDVATVACEIGLRILERVYQVDWSIDDHGYTQRTVSGFLVIAGNMRPNGVMLTVPDQYRRFCEVEPIDRFKRTQNYTQSADMRRLNFRITDTEIRSKYPLHRGVVEADVQHSVSSSGATIGQQWLVGVSGSFSVANGHDKWFAWLMFLQVVKHRRQAAIDFARIKVAETGDQTKRYGHAFPVSLSISDQVFGTSISFSLQWLCFTTYETLFKATGVFAKIDGATWASYKSDMTVRSDVWNKRGVAGLSHDRTSAAIVSPCSQQYAAKTIRDFVDRREVKAVEKLLDANCPPKESSFVRFSPQVDEIDDTQTVSMYRTGSVGNQFNQFIGGSPSAGYIPPITVHSRGSGRVRVRFTGVAVRAGYKIERPELVSYGGARVLSKTGEHVFIQTDYGKSQGCQLYRAAWDVTYELDRKPYGTAIITYPDWRQTP